MSIIGNRSRLFRAMAELERLAGVERGAIRSDRRHREVVKIRQLAMLFGIERLGMGYSEIGRAMRRDHTTVLWGERAARRLVTEEPWASIYAALVAADKACSPLAPAEPPTPSPQPATEAATAPEPARPASAAVRLARPIDDVWPGRAWWEANNARFLAAMRAAHPEMEVQ